MSLTAQRFAAKPSQRINVPKTQMLTREEAERLPLLDRMLLQEHQRHAGRLASIRTVADKLGALDEIVRAATADGAYIAFEQVSLSISRYSASSNDRGVYAVVLRAQDSSISAWRRPTVQNAVANALLASGWRIVFASAEGSTLSLDRVVFMHGRRAVETTCMRQWVLDAIEAGEITAATQGRHPAADTGTPLAASTAGATASA
ncbi:hypothetical protein ACQ858_19640 [Variovorax ureilyticus]|uniref:hypothetical protein n=1 Tax=Variovorax ureilyticus TaxID=1836198 RepID=UPI003D67832D